MTLEEILALPDTGRKIELLKKGRGKYHAPGTCENMKEWNEDLHDINDRKKYPPREVVTEPADKVFDKKTGKTITIEAKTEKQDVNHIALPIEKDQVNIHTAFTVGTEPKMTCEPSDDEENNLLNAINFTLKKNKIKYQNKKEVRSWLSEQEVAEYWWADPDDDNFWTKLWKKIKATVTGKAPQKRLKSTIWSPFRGDILWPFFVNDDLVCFMRQYKRTNLDDTETECYMIITKDTVINCELTSGMWTEKPFKHGFSKLPVIYMYRPDTLCHRIKALRERLERVLSQYGDCIDYNFFPYLLLYGEVLKTSGKAKNHVIQMMGQDAKAAYLTWEQAPDVVKFEVETLIEQMYSLTNTPRISFENLKGIATAPSGTAFQFYFMGAHMAVENHGEEVGMFIQRRVNFLVSALGEMNSQLYKPSKTIDIETDLVPYMINSISDKVQTAVNAVKGSLWSTKTGIAFIGNIDNVDEEYKEIMEENAQNAAAGDTNKSGEGDNINKNDKSNKTKQNVSIPTSQRANK